jgi:hypothetical protein
MILLLIFVRFILLGSSLKITSDVRVREECKDIPKIKFRECRKNIKYREYKLTFMLNGSCLLSFFQRTAGTSTLWRISQLKSCEMWISCCCLGKSGMLGSVDKTVIFVDGLNSANMAIKQSAYLRLMPPG